VPLWISGDPNDCEDGVPDPLDVLLKLDARIVRDEYLESGIDRRAKEDAVAKAQPALRSNCRCIVPGRREMPRKALINENPHL